MPTKPSAETQLRNTKRGLKSAKDELKTAKAELLKTRGISESYRQRATKAEKECAEWKARFDKLLSAARVTVQPIEGGDGA